MVIHNQEKRIIYKYRNTDSFYFCLVVKRETSDGTVQKKNCAIFLKPGHYRSICLGLLLKKHRNVCFHSTLSKNAVI